MNPTNIEWVKSPDGSQGYTWNPITGCLNGCDYCYARKLANTRLKERYLSNGNIAIGNDYINMSDVTDKYQMAKFSNDPFYPRFWPERLEELGNSWDRRTWHKNIKGVFVCDMSDLFGIGIPEDWTRKVLNALSDTPHRYYLLTKQPQNLRKFSPFPDNCWVGVSATDKTLLARALYIGLERIEAKVKYISFEPLLGSTDLDVLDLEHCGINWLIIGACTGTKKEMEALIQRNPALTLMPYGKKWTAQPKISWVQEIVQAADKAGIPVFLKNDLMPLLRPNRNKGLFFQDENRLRQEMP